PLFERTLADRCLYLVEAIRRHRIPWPADCRTQNRTQAWRRRPAIRSGSYWHMGPSLWPRAALGSIVVPSFGSAGRRMGDNGELFGQLRRSCCLLDGLVLQRTKCGTLGQGSHTEALVRYQPICSLS